MIWQVTLSPLSWPVTGAWLTSTRPATTATSAIRRVLRIGGVSLKKSRSPEVRSPEVKKSKIGDLRFDFGTSDFGTSGLSLSHRRDADLLGQGGGLVGAFP